MTVDGTALVTGGSAGIGAALADEFAAHGHDLVLVARGEDRLHEVADSLAADHGVETHVLVQDLSERDAAATLHRTTRDRDLRVDVLVNNAGIGVQGAFIENDLARERDVVQVNVATPAELTHRFGGEMAARGSGGILNVASSAAWFPGPYMASYYASKAYLKNFSEALAEELRPEGVTVTALCPGPVETEFQKRAGNMDTPLGSGDLQDVEAVAAAGYEGLQAGRAVVVPGWKYRALTRVSNVLPNAFTRKQTKDLNTPD